jgi:ubiquinol-cytochrome c reductase cytochrome c subunit
MVKRVLMVAGVVVVTLVAAVVVMAHGDGGDERGVELYAENCLACHGPRGEARLDTHPAFAQAISYSLEFPTLVAQGVEGTYMGPWGVNYGGPLSDEEVLDLMAYAETWSGDEVPPLPAPVVPEGLSADAAAGAELYQVNCQGCHGPMGEGRGLALYPAIPPNSDVITATRRGVGDSMPPFADANGGPLSDDEINQIMAYVRTWERPTALQALAETNPAGAWQLVLLGGLGTVLVVGLFAASRRG